MNLATRLLRSGAVQVALTWLAARYIALVCRTTRWNVETPPAAQALMDQGRPFIICLWHGRLALAPAAVPRGWRVHALVSGHRDGRLISRVFTQLGLATVGGSSRRGGVAGLLGVCRLLAQGDVAAITLDGPRGPRMRAKAGAIKAAQLSGAALLPLAAAVRRQRLLGSWDRFCLALPFSRGVILWGEPRQVPRRADAGALEGHRLTLEQALNALTAEADRRCGQPLVEPAATSEGAGRHADA